MAKISTYPLDGTPKLNDKLIGTSVGTGPIGLKDPTYNFSLQQLLDLFSPLLPGNTLQGVLDNDNTATQDINLYGKITTTDLEVTNISNLFSAYISDSLYVEGQLFDKDNSQGTTGQILISTGDGVQWFTPVDTIPTLQEVLMAGNEADVNIILTADIFAEGVNADTALIQDSFQLNGSFIDSNGMTGTSGQMLTSLGAAGVLWQNVPVYTASSPLSINPATKNITIQQANGTQNGYLSFADWINFDGKQNALSGTGIVVSNGGTITYITNNSANWNQAYNDSIVSASVSGTTSKTLTLTQRDGDTLTASWQDTGADLSLTTVGTSGPATLIDGVLNVPNYTSGGSAVWGGITGILSNQTDLQNALDLKANNSNVVHRTGNESVLGVKSFTQTAINRSSLEFDNNDPLYNSIKMYSRAANDAIEISNLSTGGGLLINNTGGFSSHGIYLVNSGEGNALLINNVGTGTGNAGNGIYLINNDSGAMIRGMISSSGPGIVLESEISSTGTPIEHIKDGITNFKVSTIGDVTANKFIKSGGTSSQFLMADGSVNSGGFITSLTGEATAAGPGAATVTLNNASVTAKVLTGLNITGGTVVSTDSILTGFGKLQNQVNGIVGGTTYQGTWNASTNTPALTSSVGTNGYYYIVNVAGNTNLNGITDWNVGDWAIFHGGTWQKVDNTDAVVSVNGYTGAVNLVTSDIPEGLTNLYFTDARARLALSFAAGSGAYDNTTGVITIPTDNSQILNGAGYITSAALAPYLLSSVAASTYYPIPTGTTSQYVRGDGSLATFPSVASEAQRLITEVYNNTGATLTKGTIVYIVGGQGNLPTVAKALAISDATSAQTYGVVQSDITNNNNGYVVVIGSLSDLDTQAYPNGTQLYLSGTTAGTWTSVKPQAPIHLVYVGVVVRSHPTQGVIEIRIQNGYELDELHDVYINSATLANGDILQYNSSNDLWENKSISAAGIQSAINLTTVGTSGPATFNGVDLNIPEYQDTTYAFSAPLQLLTGNTVTITQASSTTDGYLSSTDWNTFNNKQPSLSGTGIVVSTSGTISYIANNSSNWDTAYANRITSLTTTGTGAATLIGNVLNIPTPTATASIMVVGAGAYSTIRVGVGNLAGGNYSASLGGKCNVVANTIPYGFIGGGCGNTVTAGSSVVVGGQYNTASCNWSFVGGGRGNTASGAYSTVAGGGFSTAICRYSSVGGGYHNTASAAYSTVVGGGFNTASGGGSFVGGGSYHTASGTSSFVGGGDNNTASCGGSFVGGGFNNVASNQRSFVGGGSSNTASGSCSASLGGSSNTASGNGSFVGGGTANAASNQRSFVGGGSGNTASGDYSFVGGGYGNTASYTQSFVGGGYSNTASGTRSFVGGGYQNISSDDYTSVGGGYYNTASAYYSSVMGGRNNTASGLCSFIGGGRKNNASGLSSVVVGGGNVYSGNIASGNYSSIVGGLQNTASGVASFIGGGNNNTASGCLSSILSGCSNNTNAQTNAHIIGSNLTASAPNTTFVQGLSKTSGTFRIKHPDPDKNKTHYLQHSFVESPTAGDNIYRYVVKVVNGVAELELPEYFKFLNENTQVWVTPKNGFGSGYGKVNDELTKVTIFANQDLEYNVLIIGTRKDKDAVENWNGIEILQKIN